MAERFYKAERSYIDKLEYTSRLYGRRMVKLIMQRHVNGDPCYRRRSDGFMRPIIGAKLCHDNTVWYQQYPAVRTEWEMGRRDFMEIVDIKGDPVEADRTPPKNYRE